MLRLLTTREGDVVFLLSGLNIPNGLEPLFPMFQRLISHGFDIVRSGCLRIIVSAFDNIRKVLIAGVDD